MSEQRIPAIPVPGDAWTFDGAQVKVFAVVRGVVAKELAVRGHARRFRDRFAVVATSKAWMLGAALKVWFDTTSPGLEALGRAIDQAVDMLEIVS